MFKFTHFEILADELYENGFTTEKSDELTELILKSEAFKPIGDGNYYIFDTDDIEEFDENLEGAILKGSETYEEFVENKIYDDFEIHKGIVISAEEVIENLQDINKSEEYDYALFKSENPIETLNQQIKETVSYFLTHRLLDIIELAESHGYEIDRGVLRK